jgi:hypothetical protein
MSGVSKKIVEYTTICGYNTLRNLFCGIGLGYAFQNKYYLHVPLIVIFPTPYIGYQSYKNRDNIINYVKEIIN